MLWQIHSGDLNTIIAANKNELGSMIVQAIERENPASLGIVIAVRRLTSWDETTTGQQIEEADIWFSTVEPCLISGTCPKSRGVAPKVVICYTEYKGY